MRIFAFTSLGLIAFATFWLTTLLPFDMAWILGIGLAVLAVSYALRWFLVSVPEATALLLINVLGKTTHDNPFSNQRGVGPGLHFKWPWEQAKVGNYINLRLITQDREEDYPSKAGPMMKVKWSFQYRPRIDLLPQYIGVDETTINTGIADMGSSFLSREISGKKVTEVKSKQKEIEDGLKGIYEVEERKLETLYGIDVMQVALHDVDYEASYQEALAAKARANRIREISKGFAKDGVDPREAKDTALVVAKQATLNINKDKQEIGGEGMEAVASFLTALLKGRR